jgi:hypothetical protein
MLERDVDLAKLGAKLGCLKGYEVLAERAMPEGHVVPQNICSSAYLMPESFAQALSNRHLSICLSRPICLLR